MRDLIVQVRQYPRRSQTPDRPVPGALVVVNTYDKQETGVHGQRVAIADGDGNAVFRGIPSTVEKLAAFELDPRSGAIHAAPDLAKRASQHHGKPLPNGYLGAAATRSINIRTIVLFKTRGREIYSLISPRSLLGYGGPTVMDQGGAEPRQFGYLLSKYPEEPAGVLFGPALGGEENRLRFFFGGLLEQRLLLLNSKGHGSEEEARGIGYSMGEEALTRLTEKAARDMWRLDEQRLVKLREHSISSRSLERLHQGAGELLDEAAEAAAELRWDRYVARAREALGLDARVYPQILKTLNDVIKGMVFFLALVVPAAFFGERLFFAAADIRRQLLGLAALVLLIWMIISQVHPAFDLAHPLVIVLAFTIMAMAILVMWMVSARFNKTAAEYRSRVAQVHRADVSRFGAAYVAFMLGISNMRRRKLRTAMTLITLTLLTFSVLSFTSFEDRIRFVAMPAPFEGERQGLLIRDRNWGMLSYPAWDYARSHFGAAAVLVPRYWHSGNKGSVNYVEVRRGKKIARALGMIGLAPGERLVTGVDRGLVAGSFFEEGDEASCLLPDEMAEALGISASDAGSVRVRVFGRDLLVRGIFSAAALDDLRDLDGGSLTPIDTRVAAFDPLDQLLKEGREGEAEEDAVVEMTAALRLPAANVLITPDRTQRDFGVRCAPWGALPRRCTAGRAHRKVPAARRRVHVRRHPGRRRRHLRVPLQLGRADLGSGAGSAGDTGGDRGDDRPQRHARGRVRALPRDRHLLLGRLGARPHLRALPRRSDGLRDPRGDHGVPPGTGARQGADRPRHALGHHPQLLLSIRRGRRHLGDGDRAAVDALSGAGGGQGGRSRSGSALASTGSGRGSVGLCVSLQRQRVRSRGNLRLPALLLRLPRRRRRRQDVHRGDRPAAAADPGRGVVLHRLPHVAGAVRPRSQRGGGHRAGPSGGRTGDVRDRHRDRAPQRRAAELAPPQRSVLQRAAPAAVDLEHPAGRNPRRAPAHR